MGRRASPWCCWNRDRSLEPASRRQAKPLGRSERAAAIRAGARPARPAPAAPAAPSTDDKLAQLKKLGELKQAGALTDAEFEAQKAKILAS